MIERSLDGRQVAALQPLLRGAALSVEIGGDRLGGLVREVLPDGGLVLFFDEPEARSLAAGKPITFEIYSRDGVYRLASRVVHAAHVGQGRDEATILQVEPAQSIARIQRREYFRVRVQREVRYRPVVLPPGLARHPASLAPTLERLTRDLEAEGLRGQTGDLSASGLLLVTREPLQVGQELVLELAAPELPLRQAAKVMRASSVTGVAGLDGGCRAGLAFLGMFEADRERIIRFLFAEERRRRRSGIA